MGGIGSMVLFQENSALGPEPMMYSMRDGDDETSRGFDSFLAQLGEDAASYVRTVCNTIVITVPKAIIHCQVSCALCAASNTSDDHATAGWALQRLL